MEELAQLRIGRGAGDVLRGNRRGEQELQRMSRAIAAKGFDPGDAILRAAIREQVGSTVKRLHRNGAIENIGAGRASKWRLR